MISQGGLDFPVPACINEMHNFSICAGVVELADARDSKSRGRKAVRVRPPPPAPVFSQSRSMGVEPASGAERLARESATLGARKTRAPPPGIWPMPPDDSCVAFASSLLRSKWRDRRGLRRATPSSGTIIFQAVTCPIVFAEGSFWSTVPLNCASRLLV